MTFKEYQKQEFGYDCITTFWDDFAIADRFGISAIKDTFERAFKDWKKDYKFLTELSMVLNCRCWMHYENGKSSLSHEYSELFHKVNDYAYATLEGEELSYYHHLID